MSTRTYTLNFLGASMLPLPQGRFFMVKSAVAALNIVARRRDGQPVEFVNVGAGLQYNALDADGKWSVLEVTSAAAQVVEVVISDEASVSFANTVTVAGGVNVSEAPASAVTNRASVTAVAGVQSVLFAANASRRRITVFSDPANTTNVGLRTPGGANYIGILQPGQLLEFKGTYALDYLDSTGTATMYLFEET